MDNIKAMAGPSSVLKKNGVAQRKLIGQRAANYTFAADPTCRADLGIKFLRISWQLQLATRMGPLLSLVKIPQWMAAWQAGPPAQAVEVERLLPEKPKQTLSSLQEYVPPKYLRFAMGGSHSVYILMRIDLHHIGADFAFSQCASCLLGWPFGA